MILEDDALFINKFELNNIPKNWDMLYLGGTVFRKYEEYDTNKKWIKMSCWTTHAYIINLTNKILYNAIIKALDYDQEIDRFYIEKIHNKYNCYMANPMIMIQKSGYSDIEKKYVNYNFMVKTLTGLKKVESEIINNSYILKLPNILDNDLPNISIITPTFNRRKLFNIAIRNFNKFIYPKNKIEWIIIDDSTDIDTIEDLLPNDKRIKYIKINNNHLTIAKKRNIGVNNATNNIIIHMDDDDYYPPISLLSRVKTLIKYKSNLIKCVGCSEIGIYDIINNKSTISSDGPLSLSEASMAYYKSFWEEKKFNNIIKMGEHKSFIEYRLNNIIDIPYSFVIIAFNHKTNITNNIRKFNNNINSNFYDLFDNDLKDFINDMKKYIINN